MKRSFYTTFSKIGFEENYFLWTNLTPAGGVTDIDQVTSLFGGAEPEIVGSILPHYEQSVRKPFFTLRSAFQKYLPVIIEPVESDWFAVCGQSGRRSAHRSAYRLQPDR